MNKTKIVATVGPKTYSKEMIRKMVLAGTDVFRINLSHSSYKDSEKVCAHIRAVNRELNSNAGILIDTKGPEVRLGTINNDLVLETDDILTLTTRECYGEYGNVQINYSDLHKDVNVGDRVLINDGLVELKVMSIMNEDIKCITIHGGPIKSHKKVNVPDSMLSLDFLYKENREDIEFASKVNADFIALSFVRNANDVLDVNDMLISLKNEHMQIVSKIETKSAIEDIDNIIKISDGIMVARGDLGIEIPLESIPSVQKKLVKESYLKGKVCIVATEMLSSMETNSRPTRAEVSDVANAILDGADAVMLSGESAVGNYPIEAIETMNKIIDNTECNMDYDELLIKHTNSENVDVTTVISHSVVDAANMLNAKAIIATTISGYTARKISSHRPCCPIIATTPKRDTATSLSLNWGVLPVVVSKYNTTDEIVKNAIKIAKENIPVEKDDKIIITGGFPVVKNKFTNFLKIEEID